jgi:hypothetical protein
MLAEEGGYQQAKAAHRHAPLSLSGPVFTEQGGGQMEREEHGERRERGAVYGPERLGRGETSYSLHRICLSFGNTKFFLDVLPAFFSQLPC